MRIFAVVPGAATILAMTCAGVRAQTANTHVESAEDWAWDKIRNDEPADFSARPECKGEIYRAAQVGADDSCRLPADFVIRVLTKKPFTDQIGHPRQQRGVDLSRIGSTPSPPSRSTYDY